MLNPVTLPRYECRYTCPRYPSQHDCCVECGSRRFCVKLEATCQHWQKADCKHKRKRRD